LTQRDGGDDARGEGRGTIGGALRICAAVLLLCALTVGGATRSAYAQETHRAGLVVVDGAGASRAFCIDFAEDELSGYELIQRAGLDLAVEASAMGVTVCAIDGEGCAYPAESCFCQCQGSPCVYWSYWTHAADGWRYEARGAVLTRVRDGDVHGWRWGAGTVAEAQAPPPATLAEICAAEEVVATAPPAPASPVADAPTATADAALSSRELPTGDLLGWLGVLAVPLALGGWLLWRRRTA
jgi:hypothetical protein